MAIATEAWFRGRWAMERVIEDARGGVTGRFRGECEFAPDAQGLTCREEGVLSYRGEDFRSGRVYLWHFPGGGRVEVRYEDGRPFHDFFPGRAEAEHLCGADLYRVRYEFGEGAWSSRWVVQGPAKDYIMTTRYRRIRA